MLVLVPSPPARSGARVAGHFVEDLDLIDESDYTKPLTMVVPAFNEEVTIVDSVTNLMHCDYPRFEVVVVNDGSKDQHAGGAEARLPLAAHRPAVPRCHRHRARSGRRTRPPSRFRPNVSQLVVIDKENAGKADALNAGINASTAPYFVSLDADSHPRPARAQGTDADDPGRSADRRRRRPGGDRQRLHHPARQGGERRACRPTPGPASRWSSTSAPSPPAAPGSTGWTRS